MSKKAVACFTFDNMGEAADIGAGHLTEALPAHSHVSLTTGYPGLFDMLDRCGVRASFFVEGWNGVHHPDAVAAIVDRGHELGMHGWLHESWSSLSPEREAELARRATDALERASGRRPHGFRAPGGERSAQTAEILRDLGYRYDASLGDGMRAELLLPDLAQVPFVWPAVDGFYYLRPQPAAAADVRDTWLQTLERVADQGGIFLLICHAFITGADPERCAALEAVIRAAVADPRVEVRTAAEIAADVARAESP
jgi:peptidoglycan/xylan/chitin deacetylase (PgdA/CDA1 family)